MSDTFGPTSPRPFAAYDRDSSSWKTLPTTDASDSMPYSATWPRSGSMRNGQVFERPTSARATPANGYSSSPILPTPTSRDHKGSNQRDDTTCLIGALLPTPRASDGAKGSPNQHGRNMEALHPTVCKLLPTPEAKNSHAGQDYARMTRQGSGGHDLVTAVMIADSHGEITRQQSNAGPRSSDDDPPTLF